MNCALWMMMRLASSFVRAFPKFCRSLGSNTALAGSSIPATFQMALRVRCPGRACCLNDRSHRFSL